MLNEKLNRIEELFVSRKEINEKNRRNFGKVSTRNGWLRKPGNNFKKAGLSYSTFNRAFVFGNLTGLSYSILTELS